MIEILEACEKLALAGPLDHGWLDGIFAQDERCVYHRLCYWLVRALRPAAVVELGTCEGRCAAHMGGAREETIVYAVDSERHGQFTANTGWLGNVVFYAGGTTDEAILAEVEDGTVGVLVVDGVHAWDRVLEEVDAWTPKMRMSGIFLFDDLDHDEGMKGLLDQLPFEEKGRADDMHPGYGFGWAVVP